MNVAIPNVIYSDFEHTHHTRVLTSPRYLCVERHRIPVDSKMLGMRTISAMAIASYASVECSVYNPSKHIK